MGHKQPYEEYKGQIAYKIYLLLADASQGTVEPSRAHDIAKRAVEEACDNREGK